MTADLIFPVLGVALYSVSFVGSSQMQQLLPFFAIFIATWAACLLKAWNRHASWLALEWGVSTRQQAEEVRDDFFGWPRVAKVTGAVELWYPEVLLFHHHPFLPYVAHPFPPYLRI